MRQPGCHEIGGPAFFVFFSPQIFGEHMKKGWGALTLVGRETTDQRVKLGGDCHVALEAYSTKDIAVFARSESNTAVYARSKAGSNAAVVAHSEQEGMAIFAQSK
ncbi:MAG: hypothetical protein ACYDBT_08935 [Desulfobulbaceae bacterium]